MLWGVPTVAKLLVVTKLIRAVTDIAGELVVCVFSVFTIVYVGSVSGPMQWWIDGRFTSSKVTYAGAWELTGVVALILLL